MMNKLLETMELYAKEHRVPIINERGREVLLALVRAKKPRRVLEIGTAIGYSTLLIAANSGEPVEIVTLELDEKRAELAAGFIAQSAYASNITILTGDAGVLLTGLAGRFDLVFIDAAKGQYPDYFRKAERLLADGGVIAADNVLFRGYVMGEAAPPRRYKTIVSRLRKYIEMATNHPSFTTKIYEDGDGLAVSYHRGEKLEKT